MLWDSTQLPLFNCLAVCDGRYGLLIYSQVEAPKRSPAKGLEDKYFRSVWTVGLAVIPFMILDLFLGLLREASFSPEVKEIRIIPKSDGRFFKLQYTYEAGSHIKKELDFNRALSIDVGIHNLATCVTDEGRSFLLDGKRLKSINQWYNKNNARLQSIKDRQHLSFKTRQQSSLEMYLVI